MHEIWRRKTSPRQFQPLERTPASIGGLHHVGHAVEGDGVCFRSAAGVAIIIARLNKLANRARTGIEAAILKTGIKACVTGGGSLFRVHFKESVPQNYREAYATPEENRMLKLQLDHLFEAGYMLINTCSVALSTVMGEPEVDGLVAAMESGFLKLAKSD